MRKVLSILAVAVFMSIAYEGLNGLEQTVAARDSPIQNGVSIHGLHVALPANMKNFPAELVPLP
jgi:hypothetical protein